MDDFPRRMALETATYDFYDVRDRYFLEIHSITVHNMKGVTYLEDVHI
jgi:hypothetical protein